MIIEKIDKFVEKMEFSSQRRKINRKVYGSKSEELLKWLTKTYDVDVQKSSATGEYHYNSYNNTITGNTTTRTWTERETRFTTQAVVFYSVIFVFLLIIGWLSATIENFFDTYLGWYTITIPASMIISFYVLRNIVFRKKEGSVLKKTAGYIISAVLLFFVCDWIRTVFNYIFLPNYKFLGSKEWIRVGIQIFVTLILFLITRKRKFKKFKFFR